MNLDDIKKFSDDERLQLYQAMWNSFSEAPEGSDTRKRYEKGLGMLQELFGYSHFKQVSMLARCQVNIHLMAFELSRREMVEDLLASQQ